MKSNKIFNSIIVMFTITLFLSSCQKEQVLTENELNQKLIEQNDVNFYTEDEVQNFLQQEESELTSRTSVTSYCNLLDWIALKAIYEDLNGANWDDKRGWDVISDHSFRPQNCDLRGVEGVSLHTDLKNVLTNETNLGRIRAVNLNEIGNLVGTIPTDVQLMRFLNSFGIQDAVGVIGSIPSSFGNLKYLNTLTITGTQISGEIPAELGKAESLEWITFRDNPQLSGSIPGELSNLTNLQRIYITNNNLSGCFDSKLENLCDIRWGVSTEANNFSANFTDFCNKGYNGC